MLLSLFCEMFARVGNEMLRKRKMITEKWVQLDNKKGDAHPYGLVALWRMLGRILGYEIGGST